MHLHGRITDLEEQRTRDAALEVSPIPCPEPSGLLEAQLSSMQQKVEHLQQESHDVRSRMEAQEERWRSLRTLYEAKDEQYRALGDRVERENWEGRFREVSSRLQDLDSFRQEQLERLQIVEQRLAMDFSAEVLGPETKSSPGPSSTVQEVNDILPHIEELSSRITAMSVQLDTVKAEQDLAPRVSALVAQLKDVAPKVIAHEGSLKAVQEQVTAHDNSLTAIHLALKQSGDKLGLLASTTSELETALGALSMRTDRVETTLHGRGGQGLEEESAARGRKVEDTF